MVSIEHLRRVWHADRGHLLLRTPGPVPLGLAYVLLVETNPFPNLSLFYRTMLFEYPSVLSRFCFPKRPSDALFTYVVKILGCSRWFCYPPPHLRQCIVGVFSSPEPKAHVSYCHSAPSVVRPSVRPSSVVRPSSSVNFHIFNFFSRTA